ncbi:MAG: phosphate regulon transcriptional regulator PhoB [Burkholderiales bacterium]|nr:phosphate regulon transcriptional regulator PhoB [Burkholderiales bacterium]
MANDTTILLVEDEPAILDLLEFTLAPKGYSVRRTMDAAAALAAVREALPDLMIVDWMLPGESGVQLARAMRSDARTKGLPIIMLTARAEESDKIAGLDAGADDYITKPFSPRELLARVNALLRRRAPEHADEAIVYGPLTVDPARHEARVDGKPLEMGATEFKLLRFLTAHPERVFSRAQLLDQVWGDHTFIEERTVDVHILRLRKALAVHAAEQLVQTVRGAGYRLSRATVDN